MGRRDDPPVREQDRPAPVLAHPVHPVPPQQRHLPGPLPELGLRAAHDAAEAVADAGVAVGEGLLGGEVGADVGANAAGLWKEIKYKWYLY